MRQLAHMTMSGGSTAKVFLLMMRQDDPKKCTAARMIRFGLATAVRKIVSQSVVLHPYSDQLLTPADRSGCRRICAIDCSWKKASVQFRTIRAQGQSRRLPPLLAGNPVNYSRIGMLSTAEAIAAALHIMGFEGQARIVLDKFRWGHTFLELNGGLLREYAKITEPDQIQRIAASYGLDAAYTATARR